MRTTTDPKTSRIELRLNDETRLFIENEAKRKGQTVSKYIRDLISDYVEHSKATKDI